MKKFDPLNPLKYKLTPKQDHIVIELKYNKKTIRTISIKQEELIPIYRLVGTPYNTLSLMRKVVDCEVTKVFSPENKELLLEIWDDIIIDLSRELLNKK